jgi:hypothetical protein
MTGYIKSIVWVAILLTISAVIIWRATGGDYYTKYEVVEQVEKEIDSEDPLAAAGFYDGDTRTETIARNEFRMGLLPTPAGIVDKHAISVVSISATAWIITLGLVWLDRRRRKSLRRVGREVAADR